MDLGDATLHVTRAVWQGTIGLPKGGKPRSVPLNEVALAALLAHRHRHALVFGMLDGSPMPYHVAKHALGLLGEDAGLGESLGWHTLRRTCATHLCAAGANPVTVQAILGHQHIETTMRYAQLVDGLERSALDALCGTWAARGAEPRPETLH